MKCLGDVELDGEKVNRLAIAIAESLGLQDPSKAQERILEYYIPIALWLEK